MFIKFLLNVFIAFMFYLYVLVYLFCKYNMQTHPIEVMILEMSKYHDSFGEFHLQIMYFLLCVIFCLIS